MSTLKSKMISIALGAIGSAITVLLSHFAAAPADVQTAVAFGGGVLASGVFNDTVAKIFGVV